MKRSGLSVIAIVLTTSLTLLSACKKVEEPVPKVDTAQTPQTMPEATPPVASAANDTAGTATTTQNDRASTLQSARQELDQLKTKIDALKVKAKDATAELPGKLSQQIQGFDQDLQNLETKYTTLKDASASAWQDIKTSFDTAIAKLKGSLEKSDQQAGKTGNS